MGLIQLHVALDNPVHVVNKGTKKLVAQDIMGPVGTGYEMVCISFCGLSTRSKFHRRAGVAFTIRAEQLFQDTDPADNL